MQRYSVQFRNTILQKMIGPEKRKAADLSEEFGGSAAVSDLYMLVYQNRIPIRIGQCNACRA